MFKDELMTKKVVDLISYKIEKSLKENGFSLKEDGFNNIKLVIKINKK